MPHPNAPLGAAVTALAPEALAAQPSAPAQTARGEPFDRPHRSPARCTAADYPGTRGPRRRGKRTPRRSFSMKSPLQAIRLLSRNRSTKSISA